MRIAFPFLVPLACLLGILVVPDQAVAFSAALLSSIITLGLAAPVLFGSSETQAPEPRTETQSTPQVEDQAAQSTRPSRSWRRQLWWSSIALEVAAVAWTFVSLAGLVIAPENAHSWSLHLGGSMLMVMLLTPLVIFVRPSDNSDEPVAEELPQDFVGPEDKALRRPIPEQNQAKEDESSFWSFGEMQGDSFSGQDAAVDIAPRAKADANPHASDGVQTRRPPSPDTGDAWAAWPDEDPLLAESSTTQQSSGDSPHSVSASSDDADDMEARRALWAFPEEKSTTHDRAPEAPSSTSTPREMKAAHKAAAAEWDTADHDDEMAWDILESILEEEESRTSDGGSSWEPEEWPDFNYDV